MKPKPTHLAEQYASQWRDACMAHDYPYRPPYPPATFSILCKLIGDQGLPVLDLGSGTGDIARMLAQLGVPVHAIEPSRAMIETGRMLPGGDLPRWIAGTAETAIVCPPYTLVTAGECVQWFDWEIALPRMRELAPRTAFVFREQEQEPWAEELEEVVRRSSTNGDYEACDVVAELVSRGLFDRQGSEKTEVMEFGQPLDSYVASFHSRNGFSRKRMGKKKVAAFDEAVREVVAPHVSDGIVHVRVRGVVTWGLPGAGPSP